MTVIGIVVAIMGLAMVAGMNDDPRPRKQPLLIRMIDWIEEQERKRGELHDTNDKNK